LRAAASITHDTGDSSGAPVPPDASKGEASAESAVAVAVATGAGAATGSEITGAATVLIVWADDDATVGVGAGADSAAEAVVDDFGAVAASADDEDSLGAVDGFVAASAVLPDPDLAGFFFGFCGFALEVIGSVADTTSPLTDVTGLLGESEDGLPDGVSCEGETATEGDSAVGESAPAVPPADAPDSDDPDSDDPDSDGSAQAGIAVMAEPMPSATASAPTRPTCLEQPMTKPPVRMNAPPNRLTEAAGNPRGPRRSRGRKSAVVAQAQQSEQQILR
jgi:hypothetical protein